MSIREIARALGISKSTVHRILKEAGEADLLAKNKTLLPADLAEA